MNSQSEQGHGYHSILIVEDEPLIAMMLEDFLDVLDKQAAGVVDTVADKGIFHKNKAARDKSRLSAKVKALALAPEKAAA